MKVSPEPEQQQAILDLMRRYRDALNYSIRAVIANKALSLNRAHRLLYEDLKERYGLPARVAQDCYREAIAIAKSWPAICYYARVLQGGHRYSKVVA